MTYLYRNGALIFMGRFLYPGAVIFMVVAFLYPVEIFVSRGHPGHVMYDICDMVLLLENI